MSEPGIECMSGIKVVRSHGRSAHGIPVFWVRPAEACENNSRKFIGYEKMRNGIKRWFAPQIKYWLVDGRLIGSNSEKNAIREYHRICDITKKGILPEIKSL